MTYDLSECRRARTWGARYAVSLALAGVLYAAGESVAFGQVASRFTLHAEGAGAVSLPDYQRSALGEVAGAYLAARLAFRVAGPIALEAGYETYVLPSAHAVAQQHDVVGGLRVAPELSFGRSFLDFDAGLGITGGRTRLQITAGFGVEFDALDWLRIGPVLRYGRLFANDEDFPSDAQFLTLGLTVGLGVPPPARENSAREAPARAPTDDDHDGIADDRDLCPREPAGANPDPQRPGCPLVDRDGDGVPDRDDVCPEVPRGEHPSVQRAGCPVEDSDSDGVPDADDRCATVPQGPHPDPTRAGCPDADRDGDGVFDASDPCPDAPPGLHPDPARPGCGLPDGDGDSVPDARDACPDVAGAPSADARRNGCPGLGRITGNRIQILRPIFFDSNSNRIQRRSLAVLRAIADMLRATPEIHRLSIDGHTDEAGDADRNLELSAERAHAVMGWLIRYGNVEAERLTSQGYGETRPLVPGHTPEARAANRRVEFIIVDPPQSRPAADATHPGTP